MTPTDDRPLLSVAAWWHDLGYAPVMRDTGCHQIDGAWYLARAADDPTRGVRALDDGPDDDPDDGPAGALVTAR